MINFLQTRPEWKDTAVVIAYDDSDGWYDHQMGPIVNQSTGTTDTLTGPGTCGNGNSALPGADAGNAHAQGRCGFGPRLPMLVISPWSRHNFVDHSLTNQASVMVFVEDNWLKSERTGQGSFDAISQFADRYVRFSKQTTARKTDTGREHRCSEAADSLAGDDDAPKAPC